MHSERYWLVAVGIFVTSACATQVNSPFDGAEVGPADASLAADAQPDSSSPLPDSTTPEASNMSDASPSANDAPDTFVSLADSGAPEASDVDSAWSMDKGRKVAVGGTLAGLAPGATVTIDDNGGDSLTLAANGSFTFATPVLHGGTYAVTVVTQPDNPVQTCVVTQGTGSITSAADVTNVLVTCTTSAFTLGGTLSGLATGGSVVLQDNGGANLPVSANGQFAWPTPVISGGAYAVTVLTGSTGQTCSVMNGSGTTGNANVTSVQVICATDSFTVGGTLTGLSAGDTLLLEDNGVDNLTLTADGAFTFATPIASGATYAVTTVNQPQGERCVVTAGGGTVVDANVTTVQIDCSVIAPTLFTVGGTLSGLPLGSSVVLEDNGGDNLVVSANGAFTFATALPTGQGYAVTAGAASGILGGSTSCTVTANGTGVVAGSNITNVQVVCVSSGTDPCVLGPVTCAPSAAGAWVQRTPLHAPSPRNNISLAYDPQRNVSVTFGGYGTTVTNDTWEWNGSDWTVRTPAHSPSARYGYALAYDVAHGAMILFGGSSGGSETWTWDGTDWTKLLPAHAPSAREFALMVYDSARSVLVLYGGTKGGGETWEWNGADWTLRTPAASPGVRSDYGMAYDAAHQVTVLFGGNAIYPAVDPGKNDTWTWDGTNWTQQQPTHSPSVRIRPAVTYDPARQVTVLFGGFDRTTYFDDTWEWNGSDWTQSVPTASPMPRWYSGFAFDMCRGNALLFAGGSIVASFSDAWEYTCQ